MDTKEVSGQGQSGCGHCGMSMHGCGRGHWVHIIIKILVALFIFWVGVQVGEVKGILRAAYSSYQYGVTGSYGNANQGYYGFPGMMGGWFRGAALQATTTSK